MSLVLRAKCSFHIGVGVTEVVATTFLSLRMEKKEDEDAKCLVHLDTWRVKYYSVDTYRCE